MTRASTLIGVGLVSGGLVFAAAGRADDYVAGIEAWRAERESALQAEGGWLTVVGLAWLKDGPNRFGTAADNEVVLPKGSAADYAGTIVLRDGRASVELAEGARATIGGAAVSGSRELRDDASGHPDFLALGDLSMQVIIRGGRAAIRLRDKNSPQRAAFTGRRWYPVDQAWRVEARFHAYARAKQIRIATVIGTSEEMHCPGYAEFQVQGRRARLEGVLEGPDATELFFMFKDATSGKGTYPSGRFMYSSLPKDGLVILDFNKAYNPPCAFTPYATCPLPPPGNRLDGGIEAGEMAYRRH